jgi:hypothetical protein
MAGYLHKTPDVGVAPWGTVGLVFSSYRAAENAYVCLSISGLDVSQPIEYPSELPSWIASLDACDAREIPEELHIPLMRKHPTN